MIESAAGNLLEADAEAVVNTVNCVGYMGKGIALQFKQAFPDNFEYYRNTCQRGELRPGRVLVFYTGRLGNPRYIINFPTKRHWRGKSRLEDIRSGLADLVETVRRLGVRSIAVPPLGCGHGGLNWSVVRPMIARAFEALPDVRVLLFSPVGAPQAKTMPVRTKDPSMTPARAMLVRLMEQYLTLAYRLTLLEVQKLAYFLQESGESLRLQYEAGHYGPYAHNLNKVLERIEGHFTRGYGDSQRPDVDIELLPGAVERATAFLQARGDSIARVEAVGRLIEGFETPYGMELLSSIHWLARHEQRRIQSSDEAVRAVHGWNERKRHLFKEAHIKIAWRRLSDQGWLPVS